MRGFNFEKNLPHQSAAVKSTIGVFEGLPVRIPEGVDAPHLNPKIEALHNARYARNINQIQEQNGIAGGAKKGSNVIDVMMETGTGKTYTYTKTIFELNRTYGIFKFVVVVPTLSIKAGTINFLTSPDAREHFKEQYGKIIQVHVVESQKKSKNKKVSMPPAVERFVNAGSFERDAIQVMVINAGMINSDTMQKSFDRGLFDRYTVPFDAIAAVRPFVIIDEPHRFDKENKTWRNIQRMKPQFILRYGATFPRKTVTVKNSLGQKEKVEIIDYQNLVYTLTAVDAFNQNLVKGVVGHITEFHNGKNAYVKLIDTDGKEASFELVEGKTKKSKKFIKKEDLGKLHPAMRELRIEKLNKSLVVLSNGLELKKGDKINPYSYDEKLQEIMIQKAVRNHFDLERELLIRQVKIKPLSLFFIDNIEEYRNSDGYLRRSIEAYIETEAKKRLETEDDPFYRHYLEKTLENLSATHGGYFSRDNSDSDEAVEREVNEILHDKQALLDLENPRRFIFSKWTLREGWDNPNVFQICKLRSSGSEISKLQEVGRGLRLPVNQYGYRVKEEQFYLHYFVDFTESDFVDKLVSEINTKSGAFSSEEVPEMLSDEMIKKICETYRIDEDTLLERLDEENVITRSNKFKTGGFDFIKRNYPLIFDGVGSNKIRKASDPKKKVRVRTEKYPELKALWEKLNEKVVLEYRFEDEGQFETLLTDFFRENQKLLFEDGIKEREAKVQIEGDQAVSVEEHSVNYADNMPVALMSYDAFVRSLADAMHVNLLTLHRAIVASEVAITNALNATTIRKLASRFNDYLLYRSFDRYTVDYQKVTNRIHPTKLTDKSGNVLSEINASDVGVLYDAGRVSDRYLFEELYYDSELERQNIVEEIREVVVFTKIPKNSIKIPVAGGKSYSPDFAYVIRFNDGKERLHFIVETKNVEGDEELRNEERKKIRHAEKFFGDAVKIEFRTQFKGDEIVELIREINGAM